jgi:riboflavin synthase
VFTGLIECLGIIAQVRRLPQALAIRIASVLTPYEARPGDSIAVNGACLTVESADASGLWFTAVRETLSKTTLEGLAAGTKVNLERALKSGDRLGGHFVQGHVDGVGQIEGDRKDGGSLLRVIRVPAALMPLMAQKGSVAIDGVSLTIAETGADTISIALVPFTLSHTTLGAARRGDRVNIE